ncbi:hypothetical protein BDB00DRAFT_929519 [Zychaea mexicana]|uniref:uncharacterized protein n=1 Tax=Zychaea mexicana TaxID=64656 RepID=UPI0022FF19DC|nr:uncharacterized protein BDB00DRAFT_929519 [Zychaea mexicana]KAI9492733.1 hypothetical protein BDB00DRAFT_929519 [Zychaea mexicana]
MVYCISQRSFKYHQYMLTKMSKPEEAYLWSKALQPTNTRRAFDCVEREFIGKKDDSISLWFIFAKRAIRHYLCGTANATAISKDYKRNSDKMSTTDNNDNTDATAKTLKSMEIIGKNFGEMQRELERVNKEKVDDDTLMDISVYTALYFNYCTADPESKCTNVGFKAFLKHMLCTHDETITKYKGYVCSKE